MPAYLHLPDILREWPWPRATNPHTEECGKELREWSQQFDFFPPKIQAALTEAALLLASLAYPTFTQAQFRVATKLMFIFGTFDDASDRMNAAQVQVWVNIIMNILTTSPEAQDPEQSMIGRLVQAFWTDAVQVMSPSARRDFISEFESYTRSVVEQARDRDRLTVRQAETYMDIRRNDIGVKPSFALVLIGEDVAPGVLDSDLLTELKDYAADMIILANDLYSYNVEQSKGDMHNIISIIMVQYNITVDEAVEHVSKMHDELARNFLRVCDKLLSTDTGAVVDGTAKRYIDGLGNWIRANECFSFECPRYFGKSGLKVQQERIVELLPKVHEVNGSRGHARTPSQISRLPPTAAFELPIRQPIVVDAV
ncbi:terpenoid synthase [Marasmius fiardii PR-910]|nr:terpenoid synthase [Marasmius fiardii PR-910]